MQGFLSSGGRRRGVASVSSTVWISVKSPSGVSELLRLVSMDESARLKKPSPRFLFFGFFSAASAIQTFQHPLVTVCTIQQALVDMDKDGIEELILAYDSFFILLHFENDKVYGTDFDFYSRETIYTDGSFSWSHTDDIFGYECGISRVSFVNGILKVEELCRTEGNSKFFIGGVQVTKDQHDDYLEESNRIPVKFTAFEMAIFENNENINELKAIQLASEYWGIMDGEFDPQRGLRYRVICKRKIDEKWYEISLYRFVYNSYYEHLEIATVNIETKEIQVTPYPDGKG